MFYRGVKTITLIFFYGVLPYVLPYGAQWGMRRVSPLTNSRGLRAGFRDLRLNKIEFYNIIMYLH